MSDPTMGTEASTTLEAPAVHRVMLRAVLAPLFAVALLCGLLGWQVLGLGHDYDRVIHTEQVLSEIHHTRGLLVDHETALRAHMLAGDPAFLAPYRAAETSLPGVLDALQSSVSDNTEQALRLARLRSLYAVWKASADQTVSEPPVCKLDDRGAILAAMYQRKGTMDGLRDIVRAMVEAERALLQTREARTAWMTRVMLGSGVVLGLLLVLALVLVFRRWLRVIEGNYRRALTSRAASEASEREARTAAEALAVEIQAESRALERRYTALRDELEALRAKS